MAYRSSSSQTSNFADMLVNQKGSGTQAIVGIIILVIGIGVGQVLKNDLVTYISIAIGRAIILRLGKYQRQVGPGIQKRIPFADNVLVVDIREKVREFKAERMLTKDNIPVTIDAILRYRIIETRSKDAIINVQNFNDMIQQVSQTTLRNNIGSAIFQDILSKREEINHNVRNIISDESGN